MKMTNEDLLAREKEGRALDTHSKTDESRTVRGKHHHFVAWAFEADEAGCRQKLREKTDVASDFLKRDSLLMETAVMQNVKR
jgi:hypothetical protein